MAKKTGAIGALAVTAMLIANTSDLQTGQPQHQVAILSPPITAELEHIPEEPSTYTAPYNIVPAERTANARVTQVSAEIVVPWLPPPETSAGPLRR